MYLYLEIKKGSNEFICKGALDNPSDDPHGYARKMAKEGLRVALCQNEMGKNTDDPEPGQPFACYKPVPLDDVIDAIVTV